MSAFDAICTAAKFMDVQPEDITGPSTRPRYCEARWLAASLLDEAGWSTNEIGDVLGGRDHSTIVKMLNGGKGR